MTAGKSRSRQSQKKSFLAIIVVAAAAFALLMAWVLSSTSSSRGESDGFADALARAMAGADAEIGERLVAETDCATCHLTGDGRTAPLFDGLASAAAGRRPSLSAEAYLYEAIVSPAAHLVEGYAQAMPNNYGERYSEAELGHMIAYLLTWTADDSEA